MNEARFAPSAVAALANPAMLVCTVCGGSNLEHDPATGSSFCTVCGAVLEENTIVSELTFGETDGGQAILHGQFVSDKGVIGAAYSYAGQIPRRLNATESREITLANARRRIQQLAAAVNLSDQYVDMAHRWFILALQHSFTRGRKGTSVSAACLYIVCRQEKTSHMLLDFSEILHINVYLLGNVFLKLVRLLNLDLPLVDPSLYMARFASKLEFGEKTQQVANTALRISARMKRDWIHTGRKPSGICGACLLVSARLYGFQRSQAEVIQVVKVCESTIRKRLIEFSELPSSQLTPQEFHTIWLEHEMDPPVFIRNKQKELERELEKMPVGKRKLRKRGKHPLELTPEHSANEAVLSNEESVDEIAAQEIEQEITSLLQSEELNTIEVEKIKNEFSFSFSEQDVNLEDLDDDVEVNSALLTEPEMTIKSKIWHAINQSFLDEQAERQRIKAEEASARPVKARPKRKTTKKATSTETEETIPESALKAASKVLDTKRISKKINYSAIDDLFDPKKILIGIPKT